MMSLDWRGPSVPSVVIDPLTVSERGAFSPLTSGVVLDWSIVYTVACAGAAANQAADTATKAILHRKAARFWPGSPRGLMMGSVLLMSRVLGLIASRQILFRLEFAFDFNEKKFDFGRADTHL